MLKRPHWFMIAAIALVVLVLTPPIRAWSMPLEENIARSMLSGGDNNTISGRIQEDGADLPNITVRLLNNGVPVQTVTTGVDGIYTFTNVSNGTYTIRPEDAAYNFNPTERTVIIFFGNLNNQDFTAIFREYDVDGRIVDNGSGLSNIVVRLYQTPNTTTPIQSVVTNAEGEFLFPDVVPGNYRVTPDNPSYTFVPAFREFSVTNTPVTLADFEANINTYDIRGQVSDNGSGMANVALTIALASDPEQVLQTANTSGNGNYTFNDMEPGTYRISPTLKDYLFVPDYRDVIVASGDLNNVNFEGNINIFDVSGRITDNGVPVSQVQVVLVSPPNPDPVAFAVTDEDGNYTFVGVNPGNYRITPSRGGYGFEPPFRDITVSNGPVTGQNFEANILTYNALGRVEDNGEGVAGVTVNLSLASNPNPIAKVITDENGNFTFESLSPNEYRVTPSLPPYGFEPPYIDFSVNTNDVPNLFFEANIFYLYLPLAQRGASSTPPPTPTPSPTAIPCQVEIEPNTLADADNNGDFVPARCINGSIPTGDTNDFFRIQFPGGTFESTLSNIPAGTDYDLTLYRVVDGQPELVAISTNSGTFNENITRENLTAGVYYIGVQRFSGNSPNLYTLIWTHTP